MNITNNITCPLFVWIACAILIAAIAFAAGWSLHKNHIQIKNAPKATKKPKPEPLPDGWASWEI